MRIIKEESLIRKADIAQSPFQRDSRKHMFPNPNLFSSDHHCIALIYVTLVAEDINSVQALALLMLILALMLMLMLTSMFIFIFHIHIL